MPHWSRVFARLPVLLALGLSMLAAGGAQAIEQDDLLPVDEAFALSATASSRDAITVRWAIAEGYYLYRHRTSVEIVDGRFAAGDLVLPAGKAYTDEFFGDVETYRGALEATLPGRADAAAGSITLRIKYQGCADLGICYPPQTRAAERCLACGRSGHRPRGL